MIDELKKIGLAGLGAAALVVEKTGEAVDALAKHGEKTLENTRGVREELSRNLSECFKKAEPEVTEILDKLSQLSEDGLSAIREKLAELEALRAQQAAARAEREAQAHADTIDVDIAPDADEADAPQGDEEGAPEDDEADAEKDAPSADSQDENA